jgi:hypothetical protein
VVGRERSTCAMGRAASAAVRPCRATKERHDASSAQQDDQRAGDRRLYSQVFWMTELSPNGSYSTPVPISGQFATLAAFSCSVVNIDMVGTMYDSQNQMRGIWSKSWFNP